MQFALFFCPLNKQVCCVCPRKFPPQFYSLFLIHRWKIGYQTHAIHSVLFGNPEAKFLLKSALRDMAKVLLVEISRCCRGYKCSNFLPFRHLFDIVAIKSRPSRGLWRPHPIHASPMEGMLSISIKNLYLVLTAQSASKESTVTLMIRRGDYRINLVYHSLLLLWFYHEMRKKESWWYEYNCPNTDIWKRIHTKRIPWTWERRWYTHTIIIGHKMPALPY